MVHLVKAMVFPVVMYGCQSWTIKKAEHWRIDSFELWCWDKTIWESLGLQGDPTSPSERRSVLGVHWKDWCWSWNSNTLATWWEELTNLKRPWCWERLKVGGEGEDRGWDGWMASLTRWTWVWVDSRSWWWTGRPGVLQFMGLQRVGQDWAIEVNWIWFLASHICSVPSCPLGNYFRQLHSPTAPTSPKTYSPEQCGLLDHSFSDQLSIMAFLSSIQRCYSWAPQWGMELSVPRHPLSCHRSLSSYSIKLANIKVHWCVCAHVPSCFNYVQLVVTPWAVAHYASLSRQEYWSG